MDDYHFVRGKLDSDNLSKSKVQKGRLRSLKIFLPVFFLSALLPVFFVVAMTPGVSRVRTQANESAAFRVWIEPATVVAAPLQEVTLNVIGQYDSSRALMAPVNIDLVAPLGVILTGEPLIYKNSIAGKVTLGTVTAFASEVGTFLIEIPEDLVSVPNYSSGLRIVTSPSTLIIK